MKVVNKDNKRAEKNRPKSKIKAMIANISSR